ncbi:hypothetical protein R1sor_010338 [Riccia sorocarpa]|uniref:Uncharacterized protein n=1 Tax=Riccia sorocarpa TaxID=122646 RepID=A0ABD3I0H1_9MARC
MQESLKAQWEEEQRLLQATWEMQAMMAKVRQSDQGLALRVQELKAERGRLDEHQIKQAVQTATDLVTAEENWPSQNPDEAGPSQPSDSDLAELGRPLVPAPLTRSAILSEIEILLSGSRDEDEELVRLHGDLD